MTYNVRTFVTICANIQPEQSKCLARDLKSGQDQYFREQTLVEAATCSYDSHSISFFC